MKDKLRKYLSGKNYKKAFIKIIPYILLMLIGTKIGKAYRITPGITFSMKFIRIIEGIAVAFSDFKPSFVPFDIMVGLTFATIIDIFVYFKIHNGKKFRKGIEYGSARWGTKKDIAPFIDPVFSKNIILTNTERLMMNNRPQNPANSRNKNVMTIGGSGSGKTLFCIKPNLLQCHSSYVLTDSKGSTIHEVGHLFALKKYKIKVFNTINFKKSMHYNPFAYIHSEKDILKFVTCLITNTKGDGKEGDDFWVKAETLLYCALIGYLFYFAPTREQNFETLITFINAMETHEDDENFKNAVDYIFEEIEETDPEHFCLRQYKKFKLAAGKTAKSILISCAARLAPFDIKEVREITRYDELELDKLGDRKTILFLIMSDTDTTFNFLLSMVYTQMFNTLCEKADDVYGGKLPVHVRCLIDECANIGQIPNLDKLMATIRSREISAMLIFQTKAQIKAIYKDNAETIIGNCDSRLFLGGSEPTTLKDLSEELGQETIDMLNTGQSRGRETSNSTNYQKLGKRLMTQDELSVLDGNKCILQLRGVRPFLSDKYDYFHHPNYKYTADFDSEKNKFDYDDVLNIKAKFMPDEPVTYIEIEE